MKLLERKRKTLSQGDPFIPTQDEGLMKIDETREALPC